MIEKRGRLAERPFSYRTSRDGQVFVACQGRPVLTLRGDARRLATLAGAESQLTLAKVTGNSKHGNERRGR